MSERTRRGEEDRRREDEQMTGEPAGRTAPPGTPTAGGTNATRDKGVKPADDDNARHADATGRRQ